MHQISSALDHIRGEGCRTLEQRLVLSCFMGPRGPSTVGWDPVLTQQSQALGAVGATCVCIAQEHPLHNIARKQTGAGEYGYESCCNIEGRSVVHCF